MPWFDRLLGFFLLMHFNSVSLEGSGRVSPFDFILLWFSLRSLHVFDSRDSLLYVALLIFGFFTISFCFFVFFLARLPSKFLCWCKCMGLFSELCLQVYIKLHVMCFCRLTAIYFAIYCHLFCSFWSPRLSRWLLSHVIPSGLYFLISTQPACRWVLNTFQIFC